ncbi:MAG: serine hydroxymethyltransferase [Gemmatimonadales bacterium]|nr:serine hydroxymethyltransferase [Gemmatimonadales bacterium]MYG50674.1 serine hydroxymethyltransferase [Gemmatimonadales bacterium]MYK02720.1 serine hydroxymethyltransferase [Candidatus Palauibacter ramosifaciens]
MDSRPLREVDPAVAASIDRELERQRMGLELIASENFVSRGVLEATGCVMTNKYAEGYPGRRYYGGCEFVDEVENLARERARRLFGADHSNVQAHSGSGANMTALQALTEPGATLLGMDLSHGGHLTHGSPVNFSGLWYRVVPYGVRSSDRTIDYDALRATALEVRPAVIIAGASAYPRRIDFERFAEIAEECGARVLVDMAHIAGLVATGHHPSPVPHADVVTTTTHKTLRGPRGGLTLCREEHAKAVDKSVFPGLQGGPLMHVIAAKAVALGEALRPEFGEYSDLVVRNARALGRRLVEHGYDLVAGGTDTHLLLVDLRTTELTGKDAEALLGRAGITVNKNTVPFETRSPFVASGIRIGTAAVSTRSMGESEMERIADLMDRALRSEGDDSTLSAVDAEVRTLCEDFPLYPENDGVHGGA